MRNPPFAALIGLLLLGACANASTSKLNPFNWFNGSSETTTLEPDGGYADLTDPRGMVSQVLTLTVEPVPGGAIVRATGLPPTQAWWAASLVSDTEGEPVDGVLTYRFVIAPPPQPAPVSTQPSREVTVAVFVSDITLAQTRTITVQGQNNARSSAR